jgi:uncharacterized protein YeaO (DUF488 family)
MIQIKRVYDQVSIDDGVRFLVDRLWPRGIKKENLAIAAWLKEISPSNELRKWAHQNPDAWEGFTQRYARELDARYEHIEPVLDAARKGTITLLYAARDTEHNNAAALRDYLQQHLID